MAKGEKRLGLAEVALFGILGGLTFALKLAMAGLPNIEPVSLMVMLFAVTFRGKSVFPIYVYVLMEYLFYGFNTWSVCYLYIWPVLALAAWLLRGMTHPLAWALLSGAYGLAFGALCAPVDMVIGGFGYALTKWINGIPFDLLHCAGNFAVALVLFVPLRRVMERMYRQLKKA